MGWFLTADQDAAHRPHARAGDSEADRNGEGAEACWSQDCQIEPERSW